MLKAASRLIALAEHEFTRGCVSHWLHACCPEFEVSVAADLSEIHPEDRINLPVAIIVHASGCHRPLHWIEQQIETKRRNYKSAAIVLISDRSDTDLVQKLVSRGAIDAFIPTSDKTEVAAAALRLVIAGGHYLPHVVPGIALPSRIPADPARHKPAAMLEGLTLRELAVLELLETGKPNKLIAHKLGMSLSTAKVHVHNIIRKLKVRNRTEAVIAASKLGITSPDPLLHATAKASHLDLELAATKDDIKITPHLVNHHVVHAPRVNGEAH